MIPVRKQFEKIFTPLELRAVSEWGGRTLRKDFNWIFFSQLDGVQSNNDEDEPDFYEQAPLPA